MSNLDKYEVLTWLDLSEARLLLKAMHRVDKGQKLTVRQGEVWDKFKRRMEDCIEDAEIRNPNS